MAPTKCLATVAVAFLLVSDLLAAEFLDLGLLGPGDTNSDAASVSADGKTVVGSSWGQNGARPYRWTRGEGLVGLGSLPGGQWSSALTVSGDGKVIGGQSGQPFRWTSNDGMKGLGGTGVFYDMSDDSSVLVGRVINGLHPIRWTEATGVQQLGEPVSGGAFGVSADGTVIVGYAFHGNHEAEAFRWTEADGYKFLGLLPNGPQNGYSTGEAVSADGQTIVGKSTNGAGVFEAYRWTAAAGMEPLGLVGNGSIATDVSADGSIVIGYAQIPDSTNERAFIWSQSLGFRLLDDWLRTDQGLTAELEGWQLFEATSISNDGNTIVGWGNNPQGNMRAFVVTIPEPSTLVLAALAGIGLTAFRRRAA